MLGTQIGKKENYDEELYIKCANWCNQNNAYIKDMGSHYEVVVKESNIIDYPLVYRNIIDTQLDTISQEKSYQSALDCISYLNSTNEEYKLDAQAMNQYRDQCRQIYLQKIQSIQETQAVILTDPMDILLELPIFSWRPNENSN